MYVSESVSVGITDWLWEVTGGGESMKIPRIGGLSNRGTDADSYRDGEKQGKGVQNSSSDFDVLEC